MLGSLLFKQESNMNTQINEIKNKHDFLNFLSLYIKDYNNNKESWTNRNIETFLEAMESWVEDMEGYYENMNLPVPENVSWKIFADILYAAKVYE